MRLIKKKEQWKSRSLFSVLGTFLMVAGLISPVFGNTRGILSLSEQTRLENRFLKWRLDNILPALMERTNIDMWLVINREYNEDPVYLTLVPRPAMNARRNSILIFYYNRDLKKVLRFSGSYYPYQGWYRATWLDKTMDQFSSLAAFIKKKNPERIGINSSDHWSFGDGLSHSLYQRLLSVLGDEYASRLVSAEELCVGWLETRSPPELDIYESVASTAHELIREFFSLKVIKPGTTTRQEVQWWIRERISSLGLGAWFFPSIDIVRNKSTKNSDDNPNVIRRGDLLHCDVGIVYFGLCTDMQWNAYVCKTGESEAPEGIREALKKALQVADIFMGEFKVNRSGRQVVDETMKKVKTEGIEALIYSHPVGFHGHAAGPAMEGRPRGQKPADTEFTEHYPLFRNTAYAIEFSVFHRVPEWDNQEIRLGFEDNAVFTDAGCRFIDGCQRQLILIK